MPSYNYLDKVRNKQNLKIELVLISTFLLFTLFLVYLHTLLNTVSSIKYTSMYPVSNAKNLEGAHYFSFFFTLPGFCWLYSQDLS